MTPSPYERATGVKTDGTSHLNLTRTMADVWAAEKPAPPTKRDVYVNRFSTKRAQERK